MLVPNLLLVLVDEMAMSFENIENKLDTLVLDEPTLPHGSPQYHYVSAAQPKTSLLSTSLAREKGRVPTAYFNIDEGLEKSLPQDHPEPELLASSVGKDFDGRLIPSLSTISLLSLNNHNTSPNIAHQPTFQTRNPVPERKNSHIISRNSLTHLSQIRLQPYQKFTSPPPILQQQQQNDYLTTTSPQTIPMSGRLGTVPDSPSLDPTSLGGLPSRFWLSSQTPPRSLAGSYTRGSRSHLYELGLTTATSKAIAIKHLGSDSPTLNPVQTPSEDPPMTPLYLGSNDDYFARRLDDEDM